MAAAEPVLGEVILLRRDERLVKLEVQGWRGSLLGALDVVDARVTRPRVGSGGGSFVRLLRGVQPRVGERIDRLLREGQRLLPIENRLVTLLECALPFRDLRCAQVLEAGLTERSRQRNRRGARELPRAVFYWNHGLVLLKLRALVDPRR